MDVAHQLVHGQRRRNVAVAASGKGGAGDWHVPSEMPPIYVPREDSRRSASPAADDGSSSSARTVDDPIEATPTRPAAAAVGSRNDATRGSEEEYQLQAAAKGAKGKGEANASRPGQSPAPAAGTTNSSSGGAPAALQEDPRPSVEAGRAASTGQPAPTASATVSESGQNEATFCDRLRSCFGLCS